MDAATLGAIGVIITGLAAASASWIGHRGANSANQSGVVISGSLGLVNELQEERDKVRARLAENEVSLAAAYAELANERANRAELQGQITSLTTENQQLQQENNQLRQRIAELGGQPT